MTIISFNKVLSQTGTQAGPARDGSPLRSQLSCQSVELLENSQPSTILILPLAQAGCDEALCPPGLTRPHRTT